MGNNARTLIIRTDANASIGTGHLMRCLALAQAWKDRGGETIFITACESKTLEHRLLNEGFQVINLECSHPEINGWRLTSRTLMKYPGAWVVLDGYQFNSEHQHRIKDAGHPLLVIDDMAHLNHYYADIVLNQNLHAKELKYSCEPYTSLLLGTKYVLLRREFMEWRNWKRKIPEVARKVLVTMGGSDPNNVTLKVIHALRLIELDGMKATIIVGGSNQYYEELKAAVNDSPFPISLEQNVMNMPELMAWADMAISGGGSTCWELAFMGLPDLILIIANNQQAIAERLDASGIVVNLGWNDTPSQSEIVKEVMRLMCDKDTRERMSLQSQQLVDVDGVNRVLMYMKNQSVRFRKVHETDCKLLWDWANDLHVRTVSFHQAQIPWEEHVRWFKSKITNPNFLFLIAMDSIDRPIGQARFDLDKKNKEAVISVSVDRKYRGRGYGSTMIRLASQKLFHLSRINLIHAYIKKNNEASIHAFVKAGYKEAGVTEIQGHQSIHLLLQKKQGKDK